MDMDNLICLPKLVIVLPLNGHFRELVVSPCYMQMQRERERTLL